MHPYVWEEQMMMKQCVEQRVKHNGKDKGKRDVRRKTGEVRTRAKAEVKLSL
jgi:hypothetical protein